MKAIPDWASYAHEVYLRKTGCYLGDLSCKRRTRVLVAALDAEPGGRVAIEAAVAAVVVKQRAARWRRLARLFER